MGESASSSQDADDGQDLRRLLVFVWQPGDEVASIDGVEDQDVAGHHPQPRRGRDGDHGAGRRGAVVIELPTAEFWSAAGAPPPARAAYRLPPTPPPARPRVRLAPEAEAEASYARSPRARLSRPRSSRRTWAARRGRTRRWTASCPTGAGCGPTRTTATARSSPTPPPTPAPLHCYATACAGELQHQPTTGVLTNAMSKAGLGLSAQRRRLQGAVREREERAAHAEASWSPRRARPRLAAAREEPRKPPATGSWPWQRRRRSSPTSAARSRAQDRAVAVAERQGRRWTRPRRASSRSSRRPPPRAKPRSSSSFSRSTRTETAS